MSGATDTKTVEMRFDNSNFESNVKQSMSTLDKLKTSLKLKGASKGLNDVEKSSSKVKFKGLNDSLSKTEKHFSALESIATGVFMRIGMKVADAGMKIVKSLSVDQIARGWNKYAEETTAVQTIMANLKNDTSKFIDEASKMRYVEGYLDRLMWFSDETSYNFTDMTGNIGKFIANGQGLEESVTAMQGIATWAAKSGQNASTAARAMYNIAQAMGVGAMTTMDWKSIELANMATEEFKSLAIQAGIARGAIKEGEVTVASFRESLQKKWFDKDVMMDVFNMYGNIANIIHDYAVENDMASTEAIRNIKTSSELAEELGVDIESVGFKAFMAAQEAKTFSEVLDATVDAVSTKWSKFFKNVFGDYLHAKEFWTDLSERLWDIFASPLDRVNEIMGLWNAGFDENGMLSSLDKAFRSGVLNDIESSFHYVSEEAARVAVNTDSATYSIEMMEDGTKRLIKTIKNSDGSFTRWYKRIYEAKDLISGSDLFKSGINNILDAFFHDTTDEEGNEILSVLGGIRKAFWDTFFPGTNGDIAQRLWVLTKRFKEFTEGLKPTEEQITNIQNVFKAFFTMFKPIGRLFKIAGKLIGAIIKPFKNLFEKAFGEGSEGLLNFANKFDAWIEKLEKFLEDNKIFERISNGITNGFDKIRNALEWLSQTFAGLPLTDFLEQAKTNIVNFFKIGKEDKEGKEGMSFFGKAVGFFKNAVESIKAVEVGDLPEKLTPLQNFWIGIKNIFAGLKSAIEFLAPVFRIVTEFFATAMRRLADSVANGDTKIIDNIIDNIASFLNGLGNLLLGVISSLGAIGRILTGIGNFLAKIGPFISEYLDNATLKKVLRDITIIALIVLTIIGIVKMINRVKAIEGTIMGFMGSFTRFVNSLTSISTDLKQLLKSQKTETLSRSFLAIAAGVAAFAVAVAIIASLKLNPGQLWSIAGVLAAFIALSGTLIFLGTKFLKEKSDRKATTSLGLAMMAIAGSLVILASAFAIMASVKMSNGQMWSIAGIFGAFMTLVSGFVALAKLISKTPSANVAIGMIALLANAIAVSLVILSSAFAIMSSIDFDSRKMWNIAGVFGAFSVVVAGLGALAAVINKMPSSIIGIAMMAGLMFTVAASMVTLAAAFAIIASLNLDPAGLWAIAGIFGAFAAVAAALAIVGTVLAGTGVGAAGMALIALVITAIGAACLSAGIGVLSMAAGLLNLVKSFELLMVAINTYGPEFISSIKEMIDGILDIIISSAPKAEKAAVVLITSLAQGIIETAPIIAAAGVAVLVALLNSILASIEQTTPIVAKILAVSMILTIQTLADTIRANAPIVIKAFRDLFESIIELALISVAGVVEVFGPVGKLIAKKITSWIPKIRKNFEIIDDEGDSVLNKLIEDNKELTNSTEGVLSIFDMLSNLLGNIRFDSFDGINLFGDTSKPANEIKNVSKAVKKETKEYREALADAYNTKSSVTGKSVLDDINSSFHYITEAAAEAAVAAEPAIYSIDKLDDGTRALIKTVKNADGSYERWYKTIYESDQSEDGFMDGILDSLSSLSETGSDAGNGYMDSMISAIESKSDTLFGLIDSIGDKMSNPSGGSPGTGTEPSSEPSTTPATTQTTASAQEEKGANDAESYIDAYDEVLHNWAISQKKTLFGSGEKNAAITAGVQGLLAGPLGFFLYRNATRKRIENAIDEVKAQGEAYTAAFVEGINSGAEDPAVYAAEKMAAVAAKVSDGLSTEEARKEAATSASDIAASANSELEAAAEQAYAEGTALGNNYAKGMSTASEAVAGAAAGLAGKVWSYLHFSEPDKGPLSNFHTYAPDMIKLWCSGIESNLWRVSDSTDSVASEVTDGFGTALDYLSNLIDGGMSDELVLRPLIDLSEIQNGVDKIDSMLGGSETYTLYGTDKVTSSAARGMWSSETPSAQTINPAQTSGDITNYNTFNIMNNDPAAVAREVSKVIQHQINRKQAALGK